ncbi:ABC transporter permease [Clostridium brassicae]|uniref:ABC transporter permease n=1 Tax=Clostridium brassicae TaxID=2999072 RepID=A0ABT4D927_9CLOT|nr:ABC transporter permease [Clostridium brassicae]MCY6958814.1 ABC transporter permease [Clostridium brassicae]
MNVKKLTTIRLIVSSTILLIMIIISNYLNLKVSENVSNIIEYKNKVSDNGITFEELQKAKKNNKDFKLTGLKEVTANTQNIYGVLPDREIKTKMVLTDENHFILYPNEIIRGGKIDYLSVKNGSNIAIISDVLATSFFKNIDVIGNNININNEKYKIVGVYKKNNSLLYSASQDIYERVYVPYTSYKSITKDGKNYLDIISTKETSTNGEKSIYNKLTKVVGDKLGMYSVYNYTVSKKVIYEQIRILYFIMGIVAIVFLGVIMIRHIKKMIAFFKKSMKDKYLKEIIKEKPVEVKVILGRILFCLIAVIVIFNLIKFNIVFVDKYLPNENVFDIEFYRKAIIKDIQIANANECGVSNVYNRYLSNVSSIQYLLLFMEVVTFIVLLVNIKARKMLRHIEK